MTKKLTEAVVVRDWASKGPMSSEELQRTVEAAAWLICIAEQAVEQQGEHPAIVDWLDRIGGAAHQVLQGRLQ